MKSIKYRRLVWRRVRLKDKFLKPFYAIDPRDGYTMRLRCTVRLRLFEAREILRISNSE